MTKIKPPSVAGTFYPDNADTLKKQIEEFKLNSMNNYEYNTQAVIVPHAGLVYSGQLAYDGIKMLNKDIKTLFIFAPAHRVSFQGLCISSFDEWQTPLGNIQINQAINNELNQNFFVGYYDEAFAEEHSVEIQLPLIQSVFEDISIVPVLVGNADINTIFEIIASYWDDKSIGFIISSDLSHFLKEDDAAKFDNLTADMIESGDISKFQYQQACGAMGICALSAFAQSKNFSLIRNGLINSSLVTGDKTSVVGYGSWFLYTGEKNSFLSEYYSDEIIEICRNSILAGVNGDEYHPDVVPVFQEKGACFVTLERQGHLRGCIGSIIAHRSLIDDLIYNSQAAAFSDPRFRPLEKDELDDLSISVSLLSEPKPIKFKDENDLLNKIVPNKDGIIIKDGNYQAVYLPSVWEQLPDKKEFFTSLKLKAGMKPDYFSDSFEAYRFYSDYIK